AVARERDLTLQPLHRTRRDRVALQRVHDRADLRDRLVEPAERLVEQLRGLALERVPGAGDRETGREQVLDRQVVQVARDPRALVEQRGAVLGVAGLGELERERGLAREG